MPRPARYLLTPPRWRPPRWRPWLTASPTSLRLS